MAVETAHSSPSMQPVVSICLPVYNGERFLAESIESALAQTFSAFELLIADDCSSDRSQEIARNYAQKDARIVYWKNEQNKGLFANYNECMLKAKGRYIKLFAQDDLLDPTTVEEMVACFEKNNDLAMVSVGRRQIDSNGRQLALLRDLTCSQRTPGKEIIKQCLSLPKNLIGEPSATMFPRALATQGFDESYYHLGDLELWLRILKQGHFLYIDKPLCSFRRHENATTNKNISGLLYALDLIRIGNEHEDELSELGLSLDEFKMRMVRCIASFMAESIEGGDMSLQTLLDQTPKTDAEMKRQLELFKTLSFLSLKYAHSSVESLESELAKVNEKLVEDATRSAAAGDSRRLLKKAANLLRKRGH